MHHISRHGVSDFAWGGGNCLPQAKSNFFPFFFSNFKTAENVQTSPPPPRHVLAISNVIVNLPEYILTNSHFQLERNEIVLEY